jgi:N-acetylglucosaminyl-diphospho-decaprenol L-rhamnosyltransferase
VSQAAGEPLAATVPAVVIVTHDTREEALACLASAQRAGARELVLVDSGSADGTAAAVRAALPDVGVLELVNVGFGRAANAGVAATSSPVVMVANADVRFEPDSLRRLAEELLADGSLGAVGPQVVYPDGSPQASARRLPDLKTAIGHALLSRVLAGNRFTRRYRALDADPALPRDVDWLSGCALALRREAFEAVGGFDPGYFLYVEDVDLGVRLQAAGWRLRYTPSARVTHRVGASTGQRRARALIHHARGLDRFHDHHLARTPTARLLRPLVRLGLAGWVVATLVWERVERWAGVSRSTTGERGGPV